MQRLSDVPLIALVLGLAGLIPFFVGMAGLAVGGPLEIVATQVLPTYGAVILSFLAGGRWTSELVICPDAPRTGVLILAVMISLAGWFAILLKAWPPTGMALDLELVGWGVLILGFIIQYLWDRAAIRDATLPAWYQPLRLVCTLGAILSLSIAAFISWSPTFSL